MTLETEPEIDSQSAAAVDLDIMTATKETLEGTTRCASRRARNFMPNWWRWPRTSSSTSTC